MRRVVVLGAGIIGISTAVAIQETCKDVEITVIADKFSPNLTSDVAAGLIEPYLCDDDPERLIRWTQQTIEKIEEYMTEGHEGAGQMSGYWMRHQKEKVPSWMRVMRNVHVLSQEELRKVSNRNEHKFGVFFTTWYLEPTAYIAHCTEKFLEKGGKLRRMTLETVDDIPPEYDVVVNCTGLGARHLFGDTSMTAVRGQIIRVQCPPINHFFMDEDYYTLLNDDCIILGGTHDVDNWSTEVDEKTAKRMFEGNCMNVPGLRKSRVLSHHVGLRPCRPTVRLEVVEKKTSHGNRPVVHNYGHGGSGVTLHWGCALETAQLVHQLLFKSRI